MKETTLPWCLKQFNLRLLHVNCGKVCSCVTHNSRVLDSMLTISFLLVYFQRKIQRTVTCSVWCQKGFSCYTSFFFFADRTKKSEFFFVFCIFFLSVSNFDLIPRCLSNTFQNLWTGQSHIKNRQWVHVKSSLNLTEWFYHSIWNEADKTYKRTKTQT